MIRIENEQLVAEIDEQGAQLVHVYNKLGNFDYIWNGNLWPKHAPILFPAIGRSNQDSYLIDGKSFEMPQHGFASEYEFTVVEQDERQVSLQLKDNEATLKLYPYHFDLIVTFKLSENQLSLNFMVKNLNDENLSFSLGSHPAFNVPINNEGLFSDYELSFDTPANQLDYFDIIKTPNPYRAGTISQLTDVHHKTIQLNYGMFEKGLIILKTPINHVKLSSTKSKHSVQLDLADFTYLTLWTKEGANAPFLCLEPFYGLPDVNGTPCELATKEANYILAGHKTSQFKYTMTLD